MQRTSPQHTATDRDIDHLLLAERIKPITDFELKWDSRREILMIYGGIAQISGVWAFALGGNKQQGSAWRVCNSGVWERCMPQEMPCFTWLRDQPIARPWLASLDPSIYPFWEQGIVASMVLNHLIKCSAQTVKQPDAWIARYQAHMQYMDWDQLKNELVTDRLEFKQDRLPTSTLKTLADFTDEQSYLPLLYKTRLRPRIRIKNNVCQFTGREQKTVPETAQALSGSLIKFPKKKKVLLNPIQDTFPDAPFAEASGIKPLSNLIALAIDADRMGYPAKHLLFRIIDGFYFMYHIERGTEHVTLGIVKRNHQWYVDQLLGERNAPVSENLKAQAEEWMKSNRAKSYR